MYGGAKSGGAGAAVREGGDPGTRREGSLTAAWRYGRAPAGEEDSGETEQKKRHEKSTPPGAFFNKMII